MKHTLLFLAVTSGLAYAQLRIPKVPKVPGAKSGSAPASPLGGGGKVKAELDQAERALDGCDRHLKRDNVQGCAADHAKFEDSIGDAQRAIEGSTLGGAAEYATRINALKGRRDEQLKAMKGSEQKGADLNAKFSGPEAAKDKDAIEALKSFYKGFHGTWSTSAPTDELLRIAGQWERVKIETKRLLDTYPAVKSRQQMDPSTHEMIMAVRSLADNQRSALEEADKGVAEMPRLLKSELAWGRERLDKGLVDGLVASGLSAAKFVNNIDQRLKLYALIGKDHPKFDPQLEPTIRAEQKTLREAVDKFAERVIAENELPVDSYAGADAASIKETARKIWTKNFPQIKIVKIGLSGDWQRVSAWKWDDFRNAWFKVDESYLAGFLIVDTGHPKFVYVRSLNSTKDFLNGGRLDTRVGIWDPAEPPSPMGTYLREKVK